MTREEAIERIKSRYDKWALDDKDLEAIQCTFSELAESEDERIRLRLKEIIATADLYNTEYQTLLAWLEKQKEYFQSGEGLYYYNGEKLYFIGNPSTEENPYDFAMSQQEKQKEQKPNIELIQRSWYMEGYHDGKFSMEPKWIIKTGEGGPRYYENPNYGKPLKQKPTEYSNEEEYFDSELRAFLCNYDKEYDDDPAVSDVAKHFYELGKRRLGQEWSEEDKKALDMCYDLLLKSEYTLIDKGYFDSVQFIKDWLKSLRPSWKPSEQEKAALRTAIYVLTEERNFPKAAKHLQDILDAFERKEFRKDWKPTKEQMEALGYAITGDFDKIPPTSYLSRRLEEIEEFLKTL